LGRQLSFSAR
jgi:hypothetical protein